MLFWDRCCKSAVHETAFGSGPRKTRIFPSPDTKLRANHFTRWDGGCGLKLTKRSDQSGGQHFTRWDGGCGLKLILPHTMRVALDFTRWDGGCGLKQANKANRLANRWNFTRWDGGCGLKLGQLSPSVFGPHFTRWDGGCGLKRKLRRAVLESTDFTRWDGGCGLKQCNSSGQAALAGDFTRWDGGCGLKQEIPHHPHEINRFHPLGWRVWIETV